MNPPPFDLPPGTESHGVSAMTRVHTIMDPPIEAVAPQSLLGLRVLLVEDQVLIAMSLEAELVDHGLAVSGIAAKVATALDMIAKDPPDLAVLDLHLRNETSFPVAEALLARGVHFVFATGQSDAVLPPHLAHVPVVIKPYQTSDILRALTV